MRGTEMTADYLRTRTQKRSLILAQHIVNISGGKDSATCYMLAIMRGKPFRAVTADTGHESPITYDWIRTLPERTGGPVVEIVRADFSDRIDKKREHVQTKWVDDGIPDEIIQAALEALHPTGNAFLDLCIWKGRFPSRMAQFCTEFLKAEPIKNQIFDPARKVGPVVSWQGERRAESAKRANLPRFSRLRTPDLHDLLIFRPIVHWTAANTFALHKHFGLTPNPLYTQGMRRVGCFPCINSSKQELAQIFARFPDALEKLKAYEAAVASASKRGKATFFAPATTPEGARLARDQRNGNRAGERYPSATKVAEWAKTGRGGKQFDLFPEFDSGSLCSSQYGLCE